MGSESVLLGLVHSIYEAAADAQLWPAFLAQFANAVGGAGTAIVAQDLQGRSGNITESIRIDPGYQREYDEHYAAMNVWVTRGAPLLTSGNVVTSQMTCSDTELVRTEFYNDYLRRFDAYHSFGGTILREESLVSYITTLRPRRAGAFGDQEMALLRSLMPHLQRAVQLHRQITQLKSERDAAVGALDRLPIGFLLVDDKARILVMNASARSILERSDGLNATRDGLAAARPDETRMLRTLIHGAAMTAKGTQLSPPGGAMTVSRSSSRRPLSVLIVPVKPRTPILGAAQPGAALFVSDPDEAHEPDGQLFRRLFRLTPAEARIASLLMAGRSLEQAADEQHISIHTARNQLKSIFSKTATGRQGELIRLLFTSLAHVRLK